MRNKFQPSDVGMFKMTKRSQAIKFNMHKINEKLEDCDFKIEAMRRDYQSKINHL